MLPRPTPRTGSQVLGLFGGPSIGLYAGTIFLSAFLLFQVQPILAKLVLPWFGGAAAVWTISLAFYQLTYLLGNVYAHVLIQRGGLRLPVAPACADSSGQPLAPAYRARVHSGSPGRRRAGVEDPRASGGDGGTALLAAFRDQPAAASLAHARAQDARPYRFYALSNAGSLLALLSYPLLVEPSVHAPSGLVWSLGYGGFVLLCAAMAFRQPAGTLPRKEPSAEERPDWKLQLLWVALAATASACTAFHHPSHLAEHRRRSAVCGLCLSRSISLV